MKEILIIIIWSIVVFVALYVVWRCIVALLFRSADDSYDPGPASEVDYNNVWYPD